MKYEISPEDRMTITRTLRNRCFDLTDRMRECKSPDLREAYRFEQDDLDRIIDSLIKQEEVPA